jgi:hypothetical protein
LGSGSIQGRAREWEGKSCQDFRHSLADRYIFFILCLMLVTIPRASSVLITPPRLLVQSSTLNNPTNEYFLLECLQVAPPIAIPSAACQQTLMVHAFAFSYGQPFIGTSWSCCEGSVAVCELHTSVLAQVCERKLIDVQGIITHLIASTTEWASKSPALQRAINSIDLP